MRNFLELQAASFVIIFAYHVVFRHGGRPVTYSPTDYFNEFGLMMNAINNDPGITVKNNIIGPSIAMAAWTPEQVFDTGYIQAYTNNLGALAVEKCV